MQGRKEGGHATPRVEFQARKGECLFIGMRMSVLSMKDRHRRPMGQFRPLHHQRRVMVLRNIAVSHVTSMVLVRCSSAKSAKRASILVNFN
jgi:hypothetical protein